MGGSSIESLFPAMAGCGGLTVIGPITLLLLVSDRHLFFHRRPAGIEREGASDGETRGNGSTADLK